MHIEDLLKLDKEKKLYKYKFKNSSTPIYLIIRSYLFRQILSNSIDLQPNLVSIKKNRISKLTHYLYSIIFKNIFFAPKKQIYFFTTEPLFIKRNRSYINRLHNEFVIFFNRKIQLISSGSKRKFKMPKKDDVYYQNLINDTSIFFSFFFSLKKSDKEAIKNLLIFFSENKEVNISKSQIKDLEQILINLAKRSYFQVLFYSLFFKLKKPRLICLEDGHYLGEKAFILEAAKTTGTIVAEFQHGYVGKSHYAYNFEQSMFGQIKYYLPDYFLTFGEYWSGRVRTPSKKIEIGNPEIIKSFKKFKTLNDNANRRKILFLSTTHNKNRLISLCKKILKYDFKKEYDFVIRPHPSEVDNFESNFKEILSNGFELDNNQNLYDTLVDTEIVISLYVTTALYESILFTKKIFLMKTDYSDFDPNPIFLSFSNFDELIDGILKSNKIKVSKSDIWNENYIQNFQSFLNILEI